MNSLIEVQYAVRFEREAQNRDLQAEREQDRWAWWMAAAAAPHDAKESRIRRVAVQLGEFVAELRCQLESRFAPEPDAMAC